MQLSRDGGLTWESAWSNEYPWGNGPYAGSFVVGPNPQYGGNEEPFRFRTTFTLPKGFTSPSLVGSVASDDQTKSVIVNGVTILDMPTGWANWPDYGSGNFDFATTDVSMFHCGVNLLEFETTNLGGVSGVVFSAVAS